MTTYAVTTSAELMENYVQADYLLPQDQFIALQTDVGASLLFSVGTGGSLYLTMEVPGDAAGWQQVDLSTAQIRSDFADRATVTTFGAAQTVAGAPGSATQIHLGMVLNDGTNDHLYLSLGNSDSDLSWTQQPVWTPVPFNAVAGDGTPITPPSPFRINNVFLSQATDQEYVVADIIRNPGQAAEFITRFYIDTTTPTKPAWTPRDLSIDVQAIGDQTCLGRSARAYGIDGMYTKGFVGTSGQLIYTPLVNVADPSLQPSPSRLYLPGDLVPDAIAAARNSDNTSDLFVAAQGTLYWFASTNQKDQSTAVAVLQSPMLAAVRSLYAYVADGAVTVWGLNGEDEVFYLTCPLGQQQTGSAWNVPLPILTGVDAISPFVDRGYNANTFFAHSGSGLVKVVKSPTTSLWSSRNIVVASSVTTQPASAIHSYTTHIQVTDQNGQAAPNVAVTLTATNVTSVYVNHLYYVVGPSPIELTTDALGTITIVELTASLAGTRYQVSVDSADAVPINTMDSAWQRNSAYTSVSSLQSAKIVNRDGSTRDFVPDGTSSADLEGVAASNKSLQEAYDSLSSQPTPPSTTRMNLASPSMLRLDTGEFLDGALVDFGDLINWLASGVDAAVQLIKDVANDVWHFVVSIGDAVYHAVLDCVEAVVAAATWVYNAIKIAVEDVIKFLEFVLGWQDILVTHRVLKSVFLCLGQSAVDGIESTKQQVITLSAELQSKINAWADIPDFNQTAAATLAANKPAAGQNSAPANLGIHHFQGGAAGASSKLSPDSPAQSILDDLVTLVEAEGDTLSAAADAIKTDILDQFSSLTITDVIKKFLAIVADTVLQSTENVLVTMLDVLAQLVQGMIDVLSENLDIPVLSWLYHDLTGEDLSFLDVMCLVAAIPVTIIYKLSAEAAPFTDGDPFTEGLIAAKTLPELQQQFVVSQPAPAPASNSLAAFVRTADASETTPSDDGAVLDQAKLKTFGFVTGIVSLAGAAVLVVVTNIQRLLDLVNLDIVYAKTVATVACIGNIAYVAPNIASIINAKTDNWYANLNNALTLASIVKGIAAIPAAAYNNPVVSKIFGFLESFINVVWNVPVIANIIVNKDVWDTTYKSLIPESIGNFAFNFGGILEFPIVLALAAKRVDVLAVLVLIQVGFMGTYGVCMIIAGGIYQFAPDQHH